MSHWRSELKSDWIRKFGLFEPGYYESLLVGAEFLRLTTTQNNNFTSEMILIDTRPIRPTLLSPITLQINQLQNDSPDITASVS